MTGRKHQITIGLSSLRIASAIGLASAPHSKTAKHQITYNVAQAGQAAKMRTAGEVRERRVRSRSRRGSQLLRRPRQGLLRRREKRTGPEQERGRRACNTRRNRTVSGHQTQILSPEFELTQFVDFQVFVLVVVRAIVWIVACAAFAATTSRSASAGSRPQPLSETMNDCVDSC
jgi:hypothetical protein